MPGGGCRGGRRVGVAEPLRPRSFPFTVSMRARMPPHATPPAGSMPCPFSAAVRALHALFEELLYVHVIACLFGERTPLETRFFAVRRLRVRELRRACVRV